MRRIVAGLFMSVDAVADGTQGWQYTYFDAELGAAMAAGAQDAGALLLGRRTYESYEQLRAQAPDAPVLALMDKTPTYVVSTTLSSGAQPNVSIIAGDLPGQVERLRADGDGHVLVLGSPTLVRWLLAHDLLDSLNLYVLPIVAGSGLRLFDDTTARRHPLTLTSSRALGSGVLELHYAPASAG